MFSHHWHEDNQTDEAEYGGRKERDAREIDRSIGMGKGCGTRTHGDPLMAYGFFINSWYIFRLNGNSKNRYTR